MSTTVNSLTINSISVVFSNGQIVSVFVSYTTTGAAGESWSGQHTWQLTPAESASAAATGFVNALTAKLAAATGLAVNTT